MQARAKILFLVNKCLRTNEGYFNYEPNGKLSIDSCINDYLPNMYFVPPSHPASTCQEQMVAQELVEVACATDMLVVVERMSACKLLDQF